MKAPDYRTLRALGQGVTMGGLASAVIGLVVMLFGEAGLIGLAFAAGPGLILLSNFMERRAKRAQKDIE